VASQVPRCESDIERSCRSRAVRPEHNLSGFFDLNDAPIEGALLHVEGAPRYPDADGMIVFAVRLLAERDPLIAAGVTMTWTGTPLP
jgi:hypothetical protein